MSLPKQKIPFRKKTKEWGKSTIDYYEMMARGSTDSNRSSIYNKRINYDLANGKFNKSDLEYVCNPLGLQNVGEFPATFQHYDIISPILNVLIGEERKRPDNTIVVSESTNDINRKQQALKESIVAALQQELMGNIDPSTIDPNNPPQTPEQILKYSKHNISDLVESQANKMLKFVKRNLNTKEIFKKGWKDALYAGEEIYWTGVANNEVIMRRCNPINLRVILDGDSDFIDDATAVTEVRLMTIATILDEFGDLLDPEDLSKLEDLARRTTNTLGAYNTPASFSITGDGTGALDVGVNGFSSNYSTTGSYNLDLIRVLRVEWKSFKKLYHLTYTDENGLLQEEIVDETFKLDIFKEVYFDAKVEEFWVSEAWEGVKIHDDIYAGVQPKANQRRRMDNPYHCKLGYTGLIYNAVNSQSISLIDRLKPYQYLYNIISYRLELTFARDDGKKAVVDLAQIPRSEGMDLDKWIYYLKAMGIMFINSFEEGRKGAAQGKFSTFNQFQSIDLSLANTINQYIETLEYIKNQVAFVSGVSPQRLGAIDTQELVGNVERSVQQSSLTTEYWFDSHDEVKRRVYTSLVECAKIAFRYGKKAQYVLDDMGIEMLDIGELDFDNSEFNVYMSNSNKDQAVVQTLKQLSMEALKADKADLSSIIDTVINDNPRDISSIIKRGEEEKYAREKAKQDQLVEVENKKVQAQQEAVQRELEERQKDRDLKQYEIDQNNETKIVVQELANYFKAAETDSDGDGIPDPMEIAAQALNEREADSNHFREMHKLKMEKDKQDNERSLKEKEMTNKVDIENKKIKAIEVQNKNQELLQKKQHELELKRLAQESKIQDKELKLREKEMLQANKELEMKERIEKIKLKMQQAKLAEQKKKATQAKNKPKKPKS